ncbi:alginate O-acetyltransferase AlgX-related protein [Janthinobacterium fluminis]|uniref:Cell division protein FtsQ n=1 Tax=Janthinobacterium fluminis TaxID=2987524 RepID=A0ABT5K3I8_9BURK|nr:cell division protein FtsQ [Janthinobacterium fluminis]MDC8758292.1 cell division protein FtsQ [Janthinobacterium fluminis]
MSTPSAQALRRQHRRCAAVLIALSAAGLLYEAGVLARTPAATRAAWLDGSAGRALNRALTLPYRDNLNTAAAALRYRFAGDLGAQVQEGCPGWLFYSDGLRARAGARAAFRRRLELMHAVVQSLRAGGVDVLVLTVPDKARVERYALCGLDQGDDMQQRWWRWQAGLAAEGAGVADVEAALAAVSPAFFRTDVHWNRHGAAAAAALVAAAARPLLRGGPAQQFSRQTGSATQERMGDLLVLAGLAQAPPHWRPPADREVPETIAALGSGGLLDEPAPPEVMVLGSSYSRRSNFAEALGMALGRAVWNRSVDGGQFAGALHTALRERARWPASVRLVVWELPELALSLPLSEAEQSLLRDGGPRSDSVNATPHSPSGAALAASAP